MAYRFPFFRSAALTLAAMALSTCSTDDLAPSARLDTSAPVSAIQPRPVRAAAERQAAYPRQSSPVTTITTATDLPPEGVSMDAMLGVASPATPAEGAVVGLAEEQSREIAEGSASQPVVAGIGEQQVYQLGVPSVSIAPDMSTQEDTQQTQVAMLPRLDNPVVPRQSTPQESNRMPADEMACRQRLSRIGVTFQDAPRISNGPSCGIDYPVKVSGLSGGIAVKPAVTLNCQVTEAFALWVKNELAPSARYRYLSGIRTIKPLGGYSCRTMNSRRGNAMSEHAHGNAIDVGKFVLKSGKEIDVRKPGFFAFREKGLLKAVRSDSCKYFNTVLGPGSDPHHKDHFHFDLRDRKSGYRHCD